MDSDQKMATYRTVQDSFAVQGFSPLTCDICKFSDITETTAGYVCRNCGIMLEAQKYSMIDHIMLTLSNMRLVLERHRWEQERRG